MPALFIFILLLLSCLKVTGQTGEKAVFGGLMYKSSGLGIALQSKLNSGKGLGRQVDLEMAWFRHPQEVKSFNAEVNNPSPFVFGKLNKAAIMKLGYSATRMIAAFTDAQRVGIDLIAGGGIMAGFLKPVYINLIYPDGMGYETLVAEKYNPSKHTDKTRIAGYSDGRLGWNELSARLGLHVSAGAGFTWGYYTDFPKRLETGFYLEYFDQGLPVMALAKNKALQQGVYARLYVGKKQAKN